MKEIHLPTLHWFAMENPFTGSCGDFRFRVTPVVNMATAKEVDFENSLLQSQFWHGPFCYEKSTMEGEQSFPMSEQGLAELRSWLLENI